MVPERNRLKSQLDATNAEIDKAKHRSIPVPAWLIRQSQGLEAQIRSLNGTIVELEQQKRKLTDYIRTVNSIRAAS
jgi:TolA-binding protein